MRNALAFLILGLLSFELQLIAKGEGPSEPEVCLAKQARSEPVQYVFRATNGPAKDQYLAAKGNVVLPQITLDDDCVWTLEPHELPGITNYGVCWMKSSGGKYLSHEGDVHLTGKASDFSSSSHQIWVILDVDDPKLVKIYSLVHTLGDFNKATLNFMNRGGAVKAFVYPRIDNSPSTIFEAIKK